MSWDATHPTSPSIADLVWTEFDRVSSSGNILLNTPYKNKSYLHVDDKSIREAFDLLNGQPELEQILSEGDPFLVVVRSLTHGGHTKAVEERMLNEIPDNSQSPCVLRFHGQNPYDEMITKQRESETLDNSDLSQTQGKKAHHSTDEDIRGDKNNLINGPL